MIDFRSDTVTKPSPAMLKAMMDAETGDDVFGEDKSVNKLEALISTMFGMEAALFCPSGTMTNQIAVKSHTGPGDEVICDEDSHVYQYEGGGIASNSGVSVKLLRGDRGRITADQVSKSVNPDDVHKPVSRLVCLENTHNRGGGSCYDMEEIIRINKVCREKNLRLHLDGARIFNAIVTRNEKPGSYGKLFDSISVCLSKGLGCPVGSVLLGKKEFILKARRVRKRFGGGMRQAGYLAAAGIYALEKNIERLAEDHQHAQQVADCLAGNKMVRAVYPVETNIIIFEVGEKQAPLIVRQLEERGILCFAMSGSTIRFVLHLDIDTNKTEQAIRIIRSL